MDSMKRWLAGAAVGLMLLLAGCAMPLRGQLTAFHEWPADAPRTYRFVRTDAQRDSLEQAAWEKALRAELARAGFQETPSPRFAIGFDYRVVRHVSRVIDAYPSVHPYFWWGTWGPHGGMSIGGPMWWGPGWYPVERDRTWYEYRLRMEIEDLATRPARRVYEGTAVSDGLDPAPSAVLPLLARAILGDFPGQSGVTRQVEVPVEPRP
ncbi:MAG: DUF4136 domain-containing protein [Burkholderiaceae bacterium]|nr:DUF4136 domain-containing protein [Burkholderiaceae bacterium]